MPILINKLYQFIPPKSVKDIKDITFPVPQRITDYKLSNFLYRGANTWYIGFTPLSGLIRILGQNTLWAKKEGKIDFICDGNKDSFFESGFEKMLEFGYLRKLEPAEEIGHEYGLI